MNPCELNVGNLAGFPVPDVSGARTGAFFSCSSRCDCMKGAGRIRLTEILAPFSPMRCVPFLWPLVVPSRGWVPEDGQMGSRVKLFSNQFSRYRHPRTG